MQRIVKGLGRQGLPGIAVLILSCFLGHSAAQGGDPSVQLSPGDLSFNSQVIGSVSAPLTETVTVTGGGATGVTFGSISESGKDVGDFIVQSDTCSGNNIDGNCQITIVFQPTAVGDRSAIVTVNDSASGSPQTFILNGKGIALKLTSVVISPSNPNVVSGSQLQLAAQGNYNDESSKDVTNAATWTSSDTHVATVNQGLVTGVYAGKASIKASLQGVADREELDVQYQVVFSQQPHTTPVSQEISPGVIVQVLDNGSPASNVAVRIDLGPNPPNPALLSGKRRQRTGQDGTSTFTHLKLDYLGDGYTLMATTHSPGGPSSAISAPFSETRVGDPCLGPGLPSCSSSCADSDGDGLNDAWENAGGIDVNGDGLISAQYDVLLPGADPNQQDVYVQYDWMDYAPPGNACTADTDCSQISLGHNGETCVGPQVIATAPHSCVYACNGDSDCTSRGQGHIGERCVANVCAHTHDPEAGAPGALQAVVDSFAAHGIHLHVLRGKPLRHSTVLSFRQNKDMTDSCEGGSLSSGTAGPGKYAESLYDLKATSSLDKPRMAYHYAIFGHYSSCDTAGHCQACPAALNRDGSRKTSPVTGQSGIAEVSGNDFIVSLGSRFQDLQHDPSFFDVGTTFMHELGHNLGLRHGGGIDTPCTTVGDACPHGGLCTQTEVGNYCFQGDDTNAKPNYLSVMNYRYEFTGIIVGNAVGSTTPISCTTSQQCPAGTLCGGGVCRRLDYSNQVLPAGGNTPGLLDQSAVQNQPAFGDLGLGLSEPAGLGSGNADIFTFTNAKETGIPSTAPSQGPVDWDGDGLFNSPDVQADTTCGPEGFGDHLCQFLAYPLLKGHADWGPAGQNEFTYKFQCTPFGGITGDGASSLASFLQPELDAEVSAASPVVHPPKEANAVVERPAAHPRFPHF